MAKLVPLHSKDITPDFVREYNVLREQKTSIEARMKVLATELKDAAEKQGSKDDRGSYYLDCEGFMIGKVARKSVTFNVEKAEKLFRKKGIPECLKEITVVDNDAVEAAIAEGYISEQELESITDVSVTYSIDIHKKEEVTDEVKETQVAASKKTRGHFA